MVPHKYDDRSSSVTYFIRITLRFHCYVNPFLTNTIHQKRHHLIKYLRKILGVAAENY